MVLTLYLNHPNHRTGTCLLISKGTALTCQMRSTKLSQDKTLSLKILCISEINQIKLSGSQIRIEGLNNHLRDWLILR